MRTIDLGGTWSVRKKGVDEAVDGRVPGCVHADLLAAGKIVDPHSGDNELALLWIGESDWVYSREFTVEKEFLDAHRIHLVCEGLDTFASIKINGGAVGSAENAFRTWRFDAAKHLRRGKNTIEVTFGSTFPYIRRQARKRRLNATGIGHHRLEGANYVRKSQCNYGWDWGPKCVTAGIWRAIRLEAYRKARLASVTVTQDHKSPGYASLDVAVAAETYVTTSLSMELTVSLRGAVMSQTASPLAGGKCSQRVTIKKPELWWPNGMGAQPLYRLEVKLRDAQETVVGTWSGSVGIRTLELVRAPDKWGESFAFSVNGKPFFAKGANWIPADTFVTRVTPDHYRYLVKSARDANMNMLRVWGGGIYEDEAFYDACDEYGICVWQDFMFACSAYPAYDQKFMANVRKEIADNVVRLRHRPCIALWCGNNEIEQIHASLVGDAAEGKMTWEEYRALFDELIPEVLREVDPGRPYWPSSPHSPKGDRLDFNSPKCGDAHLWSVWHGRQPFEWYRTCEHRFNSEFGFQSFPEPRVVHGYAPAGERNITSFVMEHHQRSRIGNEAIVQYMLSWFRLPTGFASTLWLSQVLQGMAIKYAVEHWRRSMPRGMGTLYWQINDCWPVASWSSIDHPGNWKALHYMARDFYAPLLVSAVEDAAAGTLEIHVTSDLLEARSCVATWAAVTTAGDRVASESFPVRVPACRSRKAKVVDVKQLLSDHGERNLLFRITLECDGRTVSRNLAVYTRPKHLRLHAPEMHADIRQSAGGFEVAVTARRPALWVIPELRGVDALYSDRFFHLTEKTPYTIRIEPKRPMTPAEAAAALRLTSLYETYAQEEAADV